MTSEQQPVTQRQRFPASRAPRQQFQKLRENIMAAGIPLLSDAEIEQEVADRRGGYQETAL